MKNPILNFYHNKPGAFWQLLMAGIMVFFIAIMIGVYLIARQANPIILDEKGKPLQSQGY